jgi:hypothetical protein
MWHTAAMVRAKRMPSLKKLQARPRRQVRRDWRQLAEIAKAWVVASGGVVKQISKAGTP